MKRSIIVLTTLLSASFAQASYLYWQVEASQLDVLRTVGDTVTYSFNGHEVTGFNLVATKNGSYDVLASAYDTGSGWSSPFSADPVSPMTATEGSLVADLTGYTTTGYSYYIEIVGYDSSAYPSTGSGQLGTSELLAYAANCSNITTDLESIAAMPQAWTGGTYAAPEPTSGLLLLVGASLLALKRRKV